MRPIIPLVFDGIRPINMAGVPGVDFDIVAPTDIYVDAAYQRDLTQKSMALIKRMIENWSWAKYKAPTCTRVDGRLLCVDGQHTCTAAASHGGIPVIPILVVTAPTVAEQADAFVSHSRDRLAATPTQLYRAALAAGDKDALHLERIVVAAGMSFVLSPKPPTAYRRGETMAIKNIRGLIRKRGDRLAKIVLSAAVQTGRAPLRGDDISIIDTLLCDPDYADGFDAQGAAAALRGIDPKVLQDAEALSIAKGLPLWKATAAVLYRQAKKRPRTVAAPEKPSAVIASEEAEDGPFTPPPVAAPAPPAPSFRSVLPSPSGPDARTVVPMTGEPPPGRSALDQRKATR